MAYMDLDPSDWRAAYRDIRGRITRGDLAPGSPLPTIASLAAARGLTVHGARKVLGRLRDEGLVVGRQGVGYRVATTPLRFRIGRRPGFGENVRRMGRTGQSRLLAQRIVGLPSDISADMRLRAGTRVFQTELVRLVDGRPVALSQDYFPRKSLDGIVDAVAATGSVSQALAAHGVRDYTRATTRIEMRSPSAHEALILGMARSQPVFVTIGANVDACGVVIDLSRSVWRADQVTFELE